MSPLRVERFRGPIRWISIAAIVAVAPKCLMCLAAYVGIGAAVGVKLEGLEICGASAALLDAPIAWFATVGGIIGVIVFRRMTRMPGRRRR